MVAKAIRRAGNLGEGRSGTIATSHPPNFVPALWTETSFQ
jgi:hypothetical protein